MRSSLNRFVTRVILMACLAVVCFITVPAKIYAKTTDTTSSSDVQFTSIPTAADSIAMRKQMNATLAKTKEALAQAKAGNKHGINITIKAEIPKTLWDIFLLGLLGGFTAVLMPCIYPLLPLTVSFFTKKAVKKLTVKGSNG